MLKRAASSETYGPGLFSIIYFQIYKPKNQKIPCCTLFIFPLVFSFIYLLYLSLLDLTLVRGREGIDNPLFRVVCKCLLVCAGAYIGDLLVPPTRLIPWFLTEGNTCLYFAASPFLFKGKNQHKLKKWQCIATREGEHLHALVDR